MKPLDIQKPRVVALMEPPASLDFPTAVKAVLEEGIRGFALEADPPLSESALSGLINGNAPSLYAREREALADRLFVPREWLDEKIEAQRQIKQGQGQGV